MESNLTQISELLKLLEERDQIIGQITNHILDQIRPTALEALAELFGMKEPDIEWLDIQYLDSVILVVCAIRYDPTDSTDYLHKLFNHQYDNENDNVKMMRVGIPVTHVFGPKEELVQFLYSVLDDSVIEKFESSAKNPQKQREDVAFDISKLSIDQQKQFELFSQQTKDIRH